MQRAARFLQSPANWLGLGAATGVLVLQIVGVVGEAGLALAALGYATGFGVGGLWRGFPKLKGESWEAALEFSDDGDARATMTRALAGVRRLVDDNPDNRLPDALKARVVSLCDALDGLLAQWERSRGSLSLEESFHARHIATSYLPDALRTYLSIPAQIRRDQAARRRPHRSADVPRHAKRARCQGA